MNRNELGMSNGNNFEQEYFGHNDRYDDLLEVMQRRFDKAVESGENLFITNAEGLFEAYLDNIPDYARQYYNCNCCKNFINRYGNLVTIDERGNIEPVLWDFKQAPSLFANSILAMQGIVSNSRVSGVFIPEETTLGQPHAGGWDHFSVKVPLDATNRSRLKVASQVMAEKKEDYKMLHNAIASYSIDDVDQAVSLLRSEALYRSEKCLGIAEWFREVMSSKMSARGLKNKNNVVWLAVANAPVGFCHVRSSMIGTLLDDISSGMSFEAVSRRFSLKMDPSQYQRPQTAPSAGNIAQAEKIVDKLGIQNSLVRRFARLDELLLSWAPRIKKNTVSGEGVFSHLRAKEEVIKPRMHVPSVTMTWRKFAETVLPYAEEIEYKVKPGKDNYSAILTAAYRDAPPILQWDREGQRNPFSWYVYQNGASYNKWNLTPGFCKVTGITYQPSMWYEENEHQGKAVFFLLEGAKDNRDPGSGNALFPETLKSELREIRSTIEAYSRSATIEGFEEASACGIRLQAGSTWNATVRVTTKTGTAVYELDRWD